MAQPAAHAAPLPHGWMEVPRCGVCGSPAARLVDVVQGVPMVRCESCSTVRAAAARDGSDVYVDGYHTESGDEHFSYTDPSSIEYELYNGARRLALLERFEPPGRLLDVGGGVGVFCASANRRGWDATLVEPVAAACNFARTMGVHAICAGVETLDPSQGRYDAVSMIHVLEHLGDCREALLTVKPLIKQGGHLLLEVPNFGSACRRASGQRWYSWRPGQHIYHFRPRTLRKVLESAGYEVLTARSFTLTWDGIILLHYAHILGLDWTIRGKDRLTRRLRGGGATTPGPGSATGGMPPALRDDKASRRALAPVLRSIARIEERFGLGENVIAVARPMRG